MQAKPIIFNGDMVRAILDGRKTQTRRVLRLPKGCIWVYDDSGTNGMWTDSNLDHGIWHAEEIACPYGQPGDLLYVRETFVGPLWPEDEEWPDEGYTPKYCRYKADGGGCPEYENAAGDIRSAWTPSIHMPRWASRLTLEITGVRVERLQDISDEDARAEGLRRVEYKGQSWGFDGGNPTGYGSATGAFRALWNSIYGDWDSNPWVWVIEFKPHLKNVDEMLKP